MPTPLPGPQPLPTTIELSPTDVRIADARIVAIGFSRGGDDTPAGASSQPGEYVVGLGAEQALRDLGIDPFAVLDRAQAAGDGGEVVSLELFDQVGGSSVEQVMLIGLGTGRGQDYRRAGAVLARTARDRGPAATLDRGPRR